MFYERAMILLLGVLLDLIVGDPHRLWHPVQGMGWIISKTEKVLRTTLHIAEEPKRDRRKKRAAGVLLWLIVFMAVLFITKLLLYAAGRIHPICHFILSVIMCCQCIAARSLAHESRKVEKELRKGDLSGARTAVSMIVGRDTEALDEAGVAKAAVETVAENTSDGVIAPLFYLALFGIPGGMLYKAVNTMDSMLGYHNDRYEDFGKTAARMDDVLNFIPARLSGLLMVLAAGMTGMHLRGAWRIFRRDRLKHKSPNSAQTESACAGALGVQLAGDASYFGKIVHKDTIGDPEREIEAKDITRALRLMFATEFLTVIILLSTMAAAASVSGW